ncbi:MAG: CoA transferase [Dehalococcoidia bacterium]|nr:CoA transferase [Dehalococcoidia bacterium]
MIQALDGIKVLDLCRGYPPAFAAMHMGDFGADVIKVDPVGYVLALPMEAAAQTMSAYTFIDRNKRSIKLNLKSEQGKEVIYKLIKKMDVLVENSRPGTMEKLGIGYDTLKEINPRLVFCAVSGYGQTGPYRDIVGHDANFMAISGALSLIGPKDGPPCWPSNMVADFAGAGLHPLIGILIALQARERTGKGQLVDIAYLDSVFSLISFDATMYMVSGEKRRRGLTPQTGGEPHCSTYLTKDNEYITIQFIETPFWKNFCEAIGRPDLIARQWPKDDADRQEMFKIMRELFLTKTRDEWWEWAKQRQVFFGPVLYIEEAMDDPQLRSRQMIMEKEHPVLGKIKQLGNPLKLSDTPAQFKTYCPMPGEHTDEILGEMGYSVAQIQKLRETKAVE